MHRPRDCAPYLPSARTDHPRGLTCRASSLAPSDLVRELLPTGDPGNAHRPNHPTSFCMKLESLVERRCRPWAKICGCVGFAGSGSDPAGLTPWHVPSPIRSDCKVGLKKPKRRAKENGPNKQTVLNASPSTSCSTSSERRCWAIYLLRARVLTNRARTNSCSRGHLRCSSRALFERRKPWDRRHWVASPSPWWKLPFG